MCERCGNKPIRYRGKGLCSTCAWREWAHTTGRHVPQAERVYPKKPPKLCACGCGTPISRRATYTYEHYPRPDQRGRRHTEESRRKMATAQRARPTRAWTGKKMSAEARAKMSAAQKGRPKSAEHALAISRALRKNVETVHQRMALIRKWALYKAWRKAVFERDNYTCRICGQRGQRLEADHIQPIAIRPDLIVSIDNGRTLCVTCHRQTDTYGTKVRSLKGFQQRAVFQIPLELITG